MRFCAGQPSAIFDPGRQDAMRRGLHVSDFCMSEEVLPAVAQL
jgi:hypothetical protein